MSVDELRVLARPLFSKTQLSIHDRRNEFRQLKAPRFKRIFDLSKFIFRVFYRAPPAEPRKRFQDSAKQDTTGAAMSKSAMGRHFSMRRLLAAVQSQFQKIRDPADSRRDGRVPYDKGMAGPTDRGDPEAHRERDFQDPVGARQQVRALIRPPL